MPASAPASSAWPIEPPSLIVSTIANAASNTIAHHTWQPGIKLSTMSTSDLKASAQFPVTMSRMKENTAEKMENRPPRKESPLSLLVIELPANAYGFARLNIFFAEWVVSGALKIPSCGLYIRAPVSHRPTPCSSLCPFQAGARESEHSAMSRASENKSSSLLPAALQHIAPGAAFQDENLRTSADIGVPSSWRRLPNTSKL
mmetsp:Transcript_13234/g.46307  ORF Transcript_13234/g.46307 Transcript_13234/m.46307 type:complete len:202 (-) Transcript_13234:2301-2906(-)